MAQRHLFRTILAAAVCAVGAGCGGGTGGGPPKDMAVPVVVAKAEQRRILDEITVVGDLDADEHVSIQSEMDGVVETVSFEEGQSVEKGQVLFKIDEEKRAASLAEARANFELAQANLKRDKELVDKRTISSKEYDQSLSTFRAYRALVERLTRELEDATVAAPFAGMVGSREVSEGQLVRVGETLTMVVKLDVLKATFEVPERFLGSLKKGQAVEVSVAAYPDKRFQGEVFFVAPQVDRQTRTVLIKARLDNEQQLLRPGMLAKVQLATSERDAVVVPESAVVLERTGAKVYLVNEDNSVELAQVTVGKRLPGEIEIVKGVPAGATVVIEGTQKIRPGAKVAPSEQA